MLPDLIVPTPPQPGVVWASYDDGDVLAFDSLADAAAHFRSDWCEPAQAVQWTGLYVDNVTDALCALIRGDGGPSDAEHAAQERELLR